MCEKYFRENEKTGISNNSCCSDSLNLYSEVVWDAGALGKRAMTFQYIFRQRKAFN